MNKMFLGLVLLVQLGWLQAEAAPKITPRVVGGMDAGSSEFPFMVSLQAGVHFCGATLIAPDWVLTAAHCVEQGFLREVVLGMHDQYDLSTTEVHTPLQVIIHRGYSGEGVDHDIALIQLEEPSKYEPIDLNQEDLGESGKTVTATVMGWGLLEEEVEGKPLREPSILQKVEVPLVSNEVCNSEDAYEGFITDKMLCAGFPEGGKDSCSGDSGGPLVVIDESGTPVLVGIVSFGDGCARPNRYGVYTRVSAYYDWIMKTMEKSAQSSGQRAPFFLNRVFGE